MSTYLELVQDLCIEAQIPGGAAAVSSDLNGQTGQIARLAHWVKTSYTELQRRNSGHWDWLRRDFTLSLSSGTQGYAYTAATDVDAGGSISRFNEWYVKDEHNPPKIYLTASGQGTERWLNYLTWSHFQTLYNIATRENSYPVHLSIDPRQKLVFGPTPDDTYTVSGEFFRAPQVLDITDDDDTPEMPEQYHDLIVYMALYKHGFYESAPEIIQYADMMSRKLLRQLETGQHPVISLAGPMA